jgi:uncharacterized surface protein with fasciclin (FAS1) repeats
LQQYVKAMALRSLMVVACLLAASCIGSHAATQVKYSSFADALSKNPEFSIMNKLAKTPAVSQIMNIYDPNLVVTVFVPSDQAFRKLASTLRVSESALYDRKYQGIIGLVVKQHVANGAYGSTILSKGKTLQTRLAGYNLWNKNMRVYARTSNAAITRSNWAGKGIVHGIDNVLLPFRIPALG